VATDSSINVFELKRDRLTSIIVNQIEKELRKQVCLHQGNKETKDLISDIYESLQSRIQYPRKNSLIFLEYELRDGTLFLFQA
jgi:hypothetical protein